ncbi:hypothetical protein K2173_025460 [Erythroxylum novogranatense]|uniref:Uncharacterized protein n=1 Tax=Erythroxylum novogranatense TaxID=1862640 RepID=A0AAV8SBM3_9ROSI|nr:hypothetical protein K2173_025460 [Erythroxylum novogranatense]
MENDKWSFGLSGSSRSYQSTIKALTDLCVDFEEEELGIEGDDDLGAEYPCPFCTIDFDLVELCYHIDDEHHLEANSGLQACPVCATRVGVNLVAHIQIQHGDMINSLQKLKFQQNDLHSTLSFLKKELEEEYVQSLVRVSSSTVSSSKLAPDPLLSFLCIGPSSDKSETVQSDHSNEATSEEKSSNDKVLERNVHLTPMSSKECMEKAKRSEFVQGLLLSTVFDDGL